MAGSCARVPGTHEHTGGADTGAAYWPGGGFRCFHGHCDGKGRGHLIAWIDEKLRAEGKPGLASEDFRNADKPQIDAFWNVLAAGRVPTSRDVDALARVPGRGDVDAVLRAAGAILGVNASAVRRRIANARARRIREARRVCAAAEQAAERAACGTVIATPA